MFATSRAPPRATTITQFILEVDHLARIRAALTIAAAAALLCVGIPAAHASDQLAITYVTSVNDDLGTLSVRAQSGSDITALTAHIIAPGTDEEVATLNFDDFTLNDGTARDGIWFTKQPVQLAELGSYRVDVDATDADGDHISQANAGSLAYVAVPQFPEFTADRTSIDNEHRDLTVSGLLKAKLPNRDLVVMPNRTVDIIADYFDIAASVSTDDQGRFTAHVHLDNAAMLQATYYYDNSLPNYIFAQSQEMKIGIDQVPTRYILQASTQRINLGESVTLTGRLEQQTAEGWKPLAGVSGGILFGPNHSFNSYVGGFTTAADGTFSTVYTPSQTGVFQLAHHSEDPFISDGSADSSLVHVLQPVTYLDFTASRTDPRTVHADGHVDFANVTPAVINVAIQYSPDGTSWTTLTPARAEWDGMGYGFSADVAMKRPGLFRAFYDGGNDFQSIGSDSVHVGR
ncbi:hypothetical protein ACGFYM_43075 [Streptomyces sp. NPDC048231]|uniref:hypothetical protein n=1 Tax=Streptomyces sp. NPDC048231 TaxID=3365519 RepID=UPI0037198B6B